MESSASEFKSAIDKAFTTQPNVKINTTTMGDALKYKSGFTEEVDEDGNKYETFLEKSKKNKKSAKDQFIKDLLKDKLLSLLHVLDEREKLIVEDYFGLTGTPRTLEDIGGDFSLTKERVRQIKEKALRKLRNETSSLFDYM